MANKKKKNSVVLDLSLSSQIEKTTEFEVGDYDYELRQDRLTRFDEDLHFLLTQPSKAPEKTSGVQMNKECQKSTPKDAVQKISDKAVLNMDGLSGTKKIAILSSKELKEIEKLAETLKLNPGKVSGKSTHVTVKDIKRDLDEIVFSSDDEGPVILKQGETFKFDFDMEKENVQSKKVRRRKLRRQKSDAPPVSESAQVFSVSSNDITSSGSVLKTSLEVEPSKANTLEGKPSKPETSKATKAAKSHNSKPVNTVIQSLESPSKDSIITESTPTPRATSNDKGQKNRKRTSPSPVSIVNSQTSVESEFNRLSVSKALKQLPVVQPVSTISGLTHEQIYKTKLSDVKVKLIANVPMSKMCKNALSFVMAENEGLFQDAKKRKQFVDLSIHVALCEAPGFNKVIKRTPEILDWVPTYRPLTLDHTKTNVTLSERNVHKNNLDYTVFSFFGHILLWANELQFFQKMPTIIEEYDLDLSRKNVIDNLGGSHLWERLRQNKTINAKRWKHIQKYRRIFAFEEHQFVLILRCMNLGIPLA